ncbi:MAG: hypothetical protein V4736_04100, partial [Bdellovibrionota bacterium]
MSKLPKFAKFAVLFSILLTGLFVNAANSALTYHGRILKPDGNPVVSPTVEFRVQIRSPGANACVMFEESRT